MKTITATTLPLKAKSHKGLIIGSIIATIVIGGTITIIYFVEKKRKADAAAALAATPCTDLNGNIVPCAATIMKQAAASIKNQGGLKIQHLPSSMMRLGLTGD